MILLWKSADPVFLMAWLIISSSHAAISGSRKYALSFHLGGALWHTAGPCCRSLNMELVKIDSMEKAREVAGYSNGKPMLASQLIWTGLRAENVKNFSTYSWSDGTPFNESLVGYLPWNVTALQVSTATTPMCFNMATGSVRLSPTSCNSGMAVVCELKADYDRVEQKTSGRMCPAWNNFLFKQPSPDALVTTSGASSAATVRGQWERGWGTALTRTYFRWNPPLASIPEDCILLCLKRSPNAVGVQVETLGLVNRMVVCSCLIPS